MKLTRAGWILVLALGCVTGIANAHAAGCLKGAIVGAAAGHMAGHHAIVGAVAGCAIGKHLANQRKHDKPLQQGVTLNH
ncbi:hypothetical protein [Burkholderia sp. MBR-1]|uniref:hypothetical protein n=1 Tax=Burkholderia sp. MBR-1 TaxID=2732364 RepID=UPI0015EF421D|nr:hypothetical protein [Burkholderia sp. MBR-1]QMI49803.1 hypothetical protein MBR110_30500 [Burkholderia sp. MBR-1]